MPSNNDEGDWLYRVANRANVSPERVEEVLAARRIQLSPIKSSPKRLLLKRIAFAGMKTGVPDAGPFEFEWSDLDRNLWAMVTDRNLRGKSSVIEIVRWLLRGKPSDNLQEDVKSWIYTAAVQFQLDDVVYEIRIDAGADVGGNLVRIDRGGEELKLGSFTGEREFEAIMSNFFMREFALDVITIWNNAAGEDGGKAIQHGWPTLSAVMFIGTDYSSLLGDIPPASGIPIRLMQMYLGLPWVSTLMEAKAAQQSVNRDRETKSRLLSAALGMRQGRIDTIQADLDQKIAELAATPSDQDLRSALAALNARFGRSNATERNLMEKFAATAKTVSEAEAVFAEDRRNLQAHIDAEAAGAVFKALDPSCCPRCDSEIGEERRNRELTTRSCFVCNEEIVSDVDSETIRKELETMVQASKDALDKARQDKSLVERELTEIRVNIRTLENEISALTTKLASFGARNRLEMEVAVLRARLDEAQYDFPSIEEEHNDAGLIEALVTETDRQVKESQTGLLEAVSERIVYYATRFGMEALSAAQLRANMNLLLTKGGQNTSYSKVTRGEQLRLKVATVLAMISIAEEQGIGRHPGLLMIDSPGAQEVASQDLEELIAGLEEISQEFAHLQVFIAALASPAIARHVPSERMLHASGEEPLW